jgi:hypothetical protein
MIVNDFHPVWAIFVPLEANTPLLVDADAFLAGPVSSQRFKAIAGKIHQIFNAYSTIQYLQAAFSLPGNGLKPANPFAVEKPFHILACK